MREQTRTPTPGAEAGGKAPGGFHREHHHQQAPEILGTDPSMEQLSGGRPLFATNRLQIVTEAGNPLGIETLADLADPSILFVTSAVEVPIGRYTAEVLTRAELTVRPVSLEESVKGIVTKVSTGEADAGIVYATDAAAAHPRVTSVNIADEFNVIARYPIAALSTSDAATRFVTFIRSDEGQAILREFGFGSP